MFCPKRGNKVSCGFDFCPECGNEIKNHSSDANNNDFYNEIFMEKEEFVCSKPHLKAKMETVKKSKIFNDICCVIVFIIIGFIIYNNFQKSGTGNFFSWCLSDPKYVLLPLAIGFGIMIFISAIISLLYAKKPQKEIEDEYEKYCFEFDFKKNASYINYNASQWNCPECGKKNDADSEKCSNCNCSRNIRIRP